LTKRELHSCVLVFQRIRDNDRWRRAASSGFLGGHWSLGQEVRASVLFLDLVGKDGVPACSDGQAIGGTCQVTCVRREDTQRHAVLLHENLGACMHGRIKGIPQYSWEYPTILVHLYVYMYVYLYIHMYNAIFYNTFAHSSPKQLKKRPFSLASAVSTDHSPLVKAPCCSPFCLCSCNFQPKI